MSGFENQQTFMLFLERDFRPCIGFFLLLSFEGLDSDMGIIIMLF
jgi:hypothetical protein